MMVGQNVQIIGKFFKGYNSYKIMKEVFSAYIDKEVKVRFRKYCDENFLNEPAILEKLIKEFLDAKNKN